MLCPMCECSSLALYERYEKKLGLPSLLRLKCSTGSCRDITEFFTSARVNGEVLKLISKLFTLCDHLAMVMLELKNLNTLMNISKPMTKILLQNSLENNRSCKCSRCCLS